METPVIVVPTVAVGKRLPQHPPLRLMSTRSVTPLANPIGDQALLRNLPLLEKNHISSRRGIFVAMPLADSSGRGNTSYVSVEFISAAIFSAGV